KELWHGHPSLNAVQTFADNESVWTIGQRLKAERFDVGLILPNSPRSALEIWLGGVRERVGYASVWRNWMLTRAIPLRPEAVPMRKCSRTEIESLINKNDSAPKPRPPTQAHHIYQYLHLASALGARAEPLPPEIHVTPEAVADFAAKFSLPLASTDAPLWF